MSDKELIMEIFKRLDNNFDNLDDPTLAITDSEVAADALEETLYNIGLDHMYTEDCTADEYGCELWHFKVIDPDEEIEKAWDETENVAICKNANGEASLAQDWRQFKAGTSVKDVICWFDRSHSKGINWLLHGREREDE